MKILISLGSKNKPTSQTVDQFYQIGKTFYLLKHRCENPENRKKIFFFDLSNIFHVMRDNYS